MRDWGEELQPYGCIALRVVCSCANGGWGMRFGGAALLIIQRLNVKPMLLLILARKRPSTFHCAAHIHTHEIRWHVLIMADGVEQIARSEWFSSIWSVTSFCFITQYIGLQMSVVTSHLEIFYSSCCCVFIVSMCAPLWQHSKICKAWKDMTFSCFYYFFFI